MWALVAVWCWTMTYRAALLPSQAGLGELASALEVKGWGRGTR